MWSSYDGRFKLLDFGLTFHADEDDLHQIQSPGYKAPEAAEWNKYKDEMKKKRKRKLQGTYSDLSKAAPAYDKGLQNIGAKAETPATIDTTPAGNFTHISMYLAYCGISYCQTILKLNLSRISHSFRCFSDNIKSSS